MNTPTLKFFALDHFRQPIAGITFGDLWNGWDVPYFNHENSLKVVTEMLSNEEVADYDADTIVYNADTNKFYNRSYANGIATDEECYSVEFNGETFYSLQGYCFCWVSYDSVEAYDTEEADMLAKYTLQAEVVAFLRECIDYIGLGFHPDTDFTQYIDVRNNETLYSAEQAAIYNKRMAAAFDYCEENDLDIYELAMNML